jgi:serine/threonine-protein kinase
MALDAEHWEELQKLFHLAETTPEAERERVLTEACPDAELRGLALALLDAGDIEEDEAVAEDAASSADGTASLPLNAKMGPYTLVRLLGSGGIGSVYLAERVVGGVSLRSALKVLAPHAAGPAFVERFLREQHILATLDHPNITRMLDAGLETGLGTGSQDDAGQPYLVMEYVEGRHLDAYYDQHKLGIRERLELFLHVCDAVAYAHRNLVVHLDLKPSNILVTADGTVKLLDFGTSKLIEPDSVYTTTVMATPAYAAPEQLRNEPVTTACDVYSLGVILFELLAGNRPGGKASVAAMMERAISDREPEKLPNAVTAAAAECRGVAEVKLRQLLSGDLATIVAKCLSPRAKDRYPSLDALSADIRRYLDGRPVLARPQTTLYLVSKLVRRNRRAVIAAAVFTLALVASLIYAEWRQQEAIREGQRALRMQTFLYRLLYLANSNYTGKPTFTVPDFLELGVKLLPDYIKDPADLRKAQMSLAESMYENNDLEGARKVFAQVIPNAEAAKDFDTEAESEATAGEVAYLLGHPDEGLRLTSHALALSKRSGISPSVRIWSEVYYATNRDRLGFRTDENLELLRAAATEARERSALPRHETADVLYALGWDLKERERFEEAEPVFKEVLAIYSQDSQAKCDQSATYGELAFVTEGRGDVQGSLPMYQRAYEGLKECAGADSRGTLEQQDRMAGALIELGRAAEAVPLVEQSLPGWRRIAGGTPDLAEPLYVLARAYVETGRFADAEKVAEELYSVQHGKVADTDRRIGMAQLMWARALAGEQRADDALAHAQAAARLLTQGTSLEAKRVDAEAQKVLAEVTDQVSSKTHRG